MRWVILIFFLLVAFSISTGYMGDARKAAANYNKLLRPQVDK